LAVYVANTDAAFWAAGAGFAADWKGRAAAMRGGSPGFSIRAGDADGVVTRIAADLRRRGIHVSASIRRVKRRTKNKTH
jgi:hypothetical protein